MSNLCYKENYISTQLPNLVRGSTDRMAVRRLQIALNFAGADLSVDGDFGPATELAAKSIVHSGAIGKNEWIKLCDYPFDLVGIRQFIDLTAHPSVQIDASSTYSKHERLFNSAGRILASAAQLLAVDINHIYGVLCTETAGYGFDSNNSLVIRFENHIWWKYWGRYHTTEFNKHWAFNQNEGWKDHMFNGLPLHTSNSREHECFDLASTYDPELAAKSISMGLPQLMGFNANQSLYPSALSMLNAFANSPLGLHLQIAAMIAYFCSVDGMLTAIRSADWNTFAIKYNGPGQVSLYAGWLASNTSLARDLDLLTGT